MKHLFYSAAIFAAITSPALAKNYFSLKTDSKETLSLEALTTQNYAGDGRLIKVGSKDSVTLNYAPNVEDQIQAGILEDKRIQCVAKGEVTVKSWCEWHHTGSSSGMVYKFANKGMSTWTGTSCTVTGIREVQLSSKYYHSVTNYNNGCIYYQGRR